MSNRPLRVGLMGCGAVANYGHIPAIQATDGLVLCAIHDPDEETLERIQKRYNVPSACQTPEAFFASELDAIAITSPAPCHKLIYNWDMHGKYTSSPDGEQAIQKRREGRMLEGGPMVDCGTHQIDLARFWLNSEVIDFSAHGAWVDEYEAPDHLWLHMDHANGAHTMVEMSYSYHHTAKTPRKEFVVLRTKRWLTPL